MTSICPGGGDSEPKPGFSTILFVTPNVIAALLNNISTPWAVATALALNLAAYDLSTYCTTDPPADPVLTAADAVAILTPFHPGKSAAELRVEQFIGRFLWYDLCQCVGGGTPARPSAPAKPTDWPDVNPPGLPQPVTAPCDTVTSPTKSLLTDSNSPILIGTRASRGGHAPHFIPPATLARLTVTVATAGATHAAGCKVFFWKANDLQELSSVNQTFAIPGTYTWDIPLDSTISGFMVEAISQPFVLNTTDTVTVKVDTYCGGAPGSLVVPCCPPDPELRAQVSQVLELVTLMQRQLAPFAYIASTVHSGLTGDGSFSIQGLLGVKVALTTVPSSLGVADGTPEEHFDLGFITFGTADGYPHSIRLEHNPQLALPARCSAYTSLAYTLHPGVVATITELVREP